MAKTNLATVKDWPWIVTAVDLFWGGILATSVSLRVLVEYAKALRLVRESGVIDLKAFPYGV